MRAGNCHSRFGDDVFFHVVVLCWEHFSSVREKTRVREKGGLTEFTLPFQGALEHLRNSSDQL